ncbi:MAG: serine/threonine-protein kinase [Acidobacteria bacterium]|nr:MAG: serine/threonine-protein kinase [Acidobacteriota bacterium]
MSLSSGSKVGQYEVGLSIGVGGMGEVYRAKDSKLGRDVALKVLPESFASDPERLARFRREAQVLAALNHPNIAQIYGFEDSGKTHALVMELVEGPTLADRISQGPIAPDEAIAIARQIALGLEAAHEQGIIHRDLKPANVKVKDDGTVKVLDFGLAKALDPMGGSSPDVMNSPTLTARSTQLGTILGTAAYMAPEQAKGRAVDRRADIWAFGVVLFEMLAGERAFKGDDVSDVLAAVLRQEIDWKVLPAGTPKKLRRVLERCLERDPKKRLRDIGDVWSDMDTADEPAPVVVAPAAPRASAFSRALPWIAAAVIAGGAIAWSQLATPAPAPQTVVRASMGMKDLGIFVDVSKDGTRLAYASASGPAASSGITLRMLDQFDGKVIPGTENGAFPVFSPDGQWVAYNDLGDGSLKKIPITGGSSSKLCDCNLQGGGDWGGDNTIVFRKAGVIMRVSGDGGTPDAVTTLDSAKGESAHSRPQFLPGGKQILFTVTSKDGAEFAVAEPGKPGHTIVARGGDNGRYVASGHLVFLRDKTLFTVPFDLKRLAVVGSEVPVVEDVSTLGPPGTADYSVSSTGLLAYFGGAGSQGTTLAWSDRSGVSKPLPGQSQQQWGTGRLSPDGKFVANGITDGKGVRDIWTFDVTRGTLTRLTFGASGDTNDFPVWSQDNRRVFFSGIVGGKFGLYAVPADASSKATLVLATDSEARPTSVTPDGKTLLFQAVGAGKRLENFQVPITADGTGKPTPLHERIGNESGAQVSPDGRWVAYVSNESGTDEVYVLPYPGPGPKIRVSLDGGSTVRWTRDGRELLYWANVPQSRLIAVDVSTTPTFKAGQPHELFRQPSTTTWDVTTDKNRLLIELSSRQNGSVLNIVTNWFDELRRRAPAKK